MLSDSMRILRYACRYEIETEDVRGIPHCRWAIDRSTGEGVLLKFFPLNSSEFSNAVAMHRRLSPGQRYVCRYLTFETSVTSQSNTLRVEQNN